MHIKKIQYYVIFLKEEFTTETIEYKEFIITGTDNLVVIFENSEFSIDILL